MDEFPSKIINNMLINTRNAFKDPEFQCLELSENSNKRWYTRIGLENQTSISQKVA